MQRAPYDDGVIVRTPSLRRCARTLALVVLSAVLAACGSSGAAPDGTGSADGSRALSTAEAQRLAVVRFNNYNDVVREVSVTVPQAGGQLALSGWMNFVEHRGYFSVRSTGSNAFIGYLLFDAFTAEVQEAASVAALPPLPPPAGEWDSLPVTQVADPLGTVLAALVQLGQDRPDNPQLLQQSDARWLREDAVDGTRVDVLSGPSSTSTEPASPGPGTASAPAADDYATRPRYWVADSGVLLRFEGYFTALGLSTLDFADAAGIDVPPLPALN